MTPLDPVEEFMSVCQQRDISALPLRSRSRKEEQWKRSDHWKGGCFYTASGIMGSPLLPPPPSSVAGMF
ncbi:hypothetical protein ATANTOWER_012246 [Ataeniobius toweri]|uniref:Uncharacterized protein n=1 Tax=Ataeniobius toweri TaxID=208326 RepID=A0ABU7BPA6_9TELE|nr:hypothetical protein [Ataeniobius toweri]